MSTTTESLKIHLGGIFMYNAKAGFSIVKPYFPNPLEDHGRPSYGGADYLVVASYCVKAFDNRN